MLISILLASSVTLFAQNGKGFKPQVVEGGAPPVQAGMLPGWLGGKPKTLDATPQPVQNPQPELKPGEAAPQYGKGGVGDWMRQGWNKLIGNGEYYEGSAGAGGEFFGKGKMEACGTPPASAAKAYEEAKAYRNGCGAAQRGNAQKIVVNDYSTRPSYMYIYDVEGKCLGKTMVAFGNGAGGAQIACADDGSHLSPPGFHLTCFHNSGKFNPGNSLKMCGLQGQNSSGRGILIHGTGAPGTSSTWGCAGVPYSAIGTVLKTLGQGALVYNYWDPKQFASGCRNQAGRSPNPATCQLERGAPSIPQNSTGDGAPTIAYGFTLFNEAVADGFPAARERIRKGTDVSIFRELPASGAYEITMTHEEAVGPNVATAEQLRNALGSAGSGESLADFRKRLARDPDTIYTLKRDLPLLWPEEIYALQQKHKQH